MNTQSSPSTRANERAPRREAYARIFASPEEEEWAEWAEWVAASNISEAERAEWVATFKIPEAMVHASRRTPRAPAGLLSD